MKQASAELETDVALNFLGRVCRVHRPPPTLVLAHRLELLRAHVIRDPAFAFTRPAVGFETFAEGDMIATDGA